MVTHAGISLRLLYLRETEALPASDRTEIKNCCYSAVQSDDRYALMKPIREAITMHSKHSGQPMAVLITGNSDRIG